MRPDGDPAPASDEAYDAQARTRDDVLRRVYERSRGSGEPVPGLELAHDLELSREETFRILEYLAGRGLVDYLGAGPRVRITARGSALVEARGDLDPGSDAA